MNNYDINAIESLTFREGVRKRVQMYLGTDTTEGIYQSFKEILNNSTDECLAGFGKRIEITINEEKNSIKCRDFGRSVPFGFRENGENVLVSIYTKAHTGGKFNHKVYVNSSGTNGIGSSCTCLTSDYFEVNSYRDGIKATAKFIKGENVFYEETPTTEQTGTEVYFIPDKEVFKNATENYSYKRLCNEIKNISYLNSGISFVVSNEITGEINTFYSENGLIDFLKDNISNSLMKKPIICSAKDNTDIVSIGFIWSNNKTDEYHTFVNGMIIPDNGTPVTGIKTTITNTFKKIISKDIEPEIFRKGLVCVIDCKVSNPSFDGQVKSKIHNPNLKTLASKAMKEGLEEFANSPDFASIAEMMRKLQKAERAADKAREAILTQNKEIDKELKKKTVLVEKLADCRKHDETSQLLICEGKSAKGALVKARDSETTACLDIRGKIINALKNDEDKLSKNEEIRDIHAALGCGIGDKFNIKKLRYGKIGIAADMDKDGYSIVCLLLTYFYVYYPELIKAGKIYWCVTPLFKVVSGNKKYFAYNEKELESLPQGEVTRLKGLGESQPEDFRATIFSNNPRMIKFTMEDAATASKYFNILLGEDIEERRKYIFSHADFENLED